MYMLNGQVTSVSSSARTNRAQNDKYLEGFAHLNSSLWVHSTLIRADAVKASGSFTTLPVRISNYDDVANAATDRVMRASRSIDHISCDSYANIDQDWAIYVQDGQEKLTLNARSELGNLYSFAFPEALPNRLDLATYWGALGLLHDDHTEAAEEGQAWKEHQALGAGINFTESASDDEVDRPRALGLKRMAAESMLAGMAVDYDRCLYMVDKYRTEWVDVAEDPRPEAGFSSMTEYMDYRNKNIGISAFWPMVSFAMGYTPSDADNDMIRHCLEPIEELITCVNDYWSWEREYHDHLTRGDRINNCVDVAMRSWNLDEQSALEWTKNHILALEHEYVQRKVSLYEDNPTISLELRRWVEQAGCIVASSHYWASSCPRHHAWRDHRQRVGTITTIVDPDTKPDHADYNDPGSPDEVVPEMTSDSPLFDPAEVPAIKRNNTWPDSAIDMKSEHSGTTPPPAMAELSMELGDDVLMAPVHYISPMPSKGVRKMLSEAFNIWLKIPDSSLRIIDKVIGDLHNASLILDDIEDESPLRRGQMATHLIFGPASSINSANYLFVRAVKEVSRGLRSEDAVEILLDALQCMYRGQALDLHWKYYMEPPTEDQYLHMIDCKTGGLFRMLLGLAKSEAPKNQPSADMDRLVILFGRFFQIRDDYLNLCSETYSQQKGSCEDLDEGKFSHPLIQLLKLRPGIKHEVLGIFRSRNVSNSGGKLLDCAKQRIMEHLESSGALNASLDSLKVLANSIEYEITSVEDATGERNPILRLLLARLRIR